MIRRIFDDITVEELSKLENVIVDGDTRTVMDEDEYRERQRELRGERFREQSRAHEKARMNSASGDY